MLNYTATKRKRRLAYLPLLALPMLPTAGCGPGLTIDGESTTRVVELRETLKCRHLGTTRVSVNPKLYLGDSREKIADALLVKARNLAGEVGADTVVASEKISEGEQSFRLYICNTSQ